MMNLLWKSRLYKKMQGLRALHFSCNCIMPNTTFFLVKHNFLILK
jgi:hypothetical protein